MTKLHQYRDRCRDEYFARRKTVGVSHFGTYLACHSKAPPTVAEYDEWLASLSDRARAHTNMTGAKLRRAVIMKRGGQTHSEIGLAIGATSGGVTKWLAKLPPELAA